MVSAMLSGIAAGMGLLVSPDHLRMWGNLAGQLGPGFWLAVVGAVLVFAWSAGSYRRLAIASAGDGGYLSNLRLRFGFAGVALALASRLSYYRNPAGRAGTNNMRALPNQDCK